MKEYVWLFPIIFMFHDMEEIIRFKFFLHLVFVNIFIAQKLMGWFTKKISNQIQV